MAFIVKNYGDGSLGDVTTVTGTVNSSARVTAVTATSITINTSAKTNGTATFDEGAKILIHVSATTADSYKKYLGKWMLANIVRVSNGVLTLDADPSTLIPSDELAKYYVQAVAVAQFRNLTLSTGTAVSPVVYSASNYHGGIVAIMCSETLTFDGGHISLTDRGIPVANKTLRPVTTNYDVAADTTNYSGYENSGTKDYFLLNAGDGAAFIIAKKLICSEDSRIGNTTTRGYQFFRGNSSSVVYNETKPTGLTNIGGSTILIAAETIENFTPYMISKYRSSASTAGQGICRAYIASETKLRNDEGLYAYDCISNKTRIRQMNIKSFGNGGFGDIANITTQMNNYATVTAIDGVRVTYKDATTTGLAQLAAGALVMIHFNHKGNTNVEHAGRFILANVLANNGTVLTLDTAPPNISVTDYACQIVTIPQAQNYTLSVENSATPVFNGAQGGIFAVAVSNNADLSGGKINVETAGANGYAYLREGLAVIGNAQDSNKLPIGQGDGSVFILAKNLTVNANSKIYSFSKVYTAAAKRYVYGSAGGHKGSYARNYGGSGKCWSDTDRPQMSHIMIVADKITGLTAEFLIGADGGNRLPCYNGGHLVNERDHCGSQGWAFIYCNEAVNQNLDYIFFEN